MSPGKHAVPGDEIPSFSGDVPEDLALASKVVRRRFYRIFAQGATGFGVAFVLITVFATALGSAAVLVTPAATGTRPVSVAIALSAVAVACGVVSLIRPVPGPVRFTLGAVPPSALLLAASATGSSSDPALDYVAGILGLAAATIGVTYVIIAGLRFWSHFKRRLAEIDGTKPPSAPPAQ